MNTHDRDEQRSIRIFRTIRRTRKPRTAACSHTAACFLAMLMTEGGSTHLLVGVRGPACGTEVGSNLSPWPMVGRLTTVVASAGCSSNRMLSCGSNAAK